jgi:hypothetical protein
MQACVWRYSWDETAAAVHRTIEDALARAPRASAAAAPPTRDDGVADPAAMRLPVSTALARAGAPGAVTLPAADPDLKVASA